MVVKQPLWVKYKQDLLRLLIDLDPEKRSEVLDRHSREPRS